MAKVVGFTALLYGRDYLGWAIRSIIDHIDEYHVAYSPIGAHGHRTDTPCPETRAELYAIASAAAGSKLRWHDGEWPHEGAQRDSIHEYAPDADAIIVCDSDEIYNEQLIEQITQYIPTAMYDWRSVRLPFIHFYRNFNHAVLHDPAYPVRLIFPKAEIGESTFSSDFWMKQVVNHMGYCQRSEIVRYKLKIHGHKNELRCDADEYTDGIYLDRNRWTDLHPVGSEYWNAERVDPLEFMPRWMQDHPFYHLQEIE